MGPVLLAALVIVMAGTLVLAKAMDGKDFLNALGFAGTIAGYRAMMSFPSATTTTKETDPTTGKTTETKTQQPLGMQTPVSVVPPIVVAPTPSATPTNVTVVNKDPVPVDVVDPAKPTP